MRESVRPQLLRHGASRARRVSLLRQTLEELRARLDPSHLDQDPLGFAHRYVDPLDQEVVGFLAAVFAYGRLDLILRNLENLFRPLSSRPAQWILETSVAEWRKTFKGFRYRFHNEQDLLTLLGLLKDLLARYGSIQQSFARFLIFNKNGQPNLRLSLSEWTRHLFETATSTSKSPLGSSTGGIRHLLATPDAGSPCKRWHLYLRWMVRGPDGFDLGLWQCLSPRDLLMPLDTHTARISRWLGLTQISSPSWKMAEEVSSCLREVHPEDPIRYDFPLARLGIAGLCPRIRVPSLCQKCLLRRACNADQLV